MENSKPLVISRIKDKDGMQQAYARESKLYVDGSTMHIAGSSSTQDWVLDDITIPCCQTHKTLRYKDAKMLLESNKQITSLTGHSLGGSVALQLQKDFPERNLNINTYGAPVVSLTPSTNRFRNYMDPVSMFDQGAKSNIHIGLNPHSYYRKNNDNNIVAEKPLTTFTYRSDE